MTAAIDGCALRTTGSCRQTRRTSPGRASPRDDLREHRSPGDPRSPEQSPSRSATGGRARGSHVAGWPLLPQHQSASEGERRSPDRSCWSSLAGAGPSFAEVRRTRPRASTPFDDGRLPLHLSDEQSRGHDQGSPVEIVRSRRQLETGGALLLQRIVSSDLASTTLWHVHAIRALGDSWRRLRDAGGSRRAGLGGG